MSQVKVADDLGAELSEDKRGNCQLQPAADVTRYKGVHITAANCMSPSKSRADTADTGRTVVCCDRRSACAKPNILFVDAPRVPVGNTAPRSNALVE